MITQLLIFLKKWFQVPKVSENAPQADKQDLKASDARINLQATEQKNKVACQYEAHQLSNGIACNKTIPAQSEEEKKYNIKGLDLQPINYEELVNKIDCIDIILKQLRTKIENQHTKQEEMLIDFQKNIHKKLKEETLNTIQQIEAFLYIQIFFSDGENIPKMHGWSISADFGRFLIQLIQKNDYDVVLEFGSGTSTVLIAKALKKQHRQSQGKPPVIQVAFEHLEKYYAQTLVDLETVGLESTVQINLVPLQPYKTPNGQTYAFYSCQKILANLAEKYKDSTEKILIVVDGPPAGVGKHARYPCLPAVLCHYKHHFLQILLDDYVRSDEKEVAKLWEQELINSGYLVTIDKIDMEKEAILLTAIPQ